MRVWLSSIARKVAARWFGVDITVVPISTREPVRSGELTETFVSAVGLTMALDLSESLDSCYAANVVDDVCLRFLRRHLDDVGVFVDVGANQGLYTCVVLNETDRVSVVALEPDPYSQDKLLRNVALNSLDSSRLRLVKDAVGSTDGHADLMLNVAGNRGGSSMLIDQRPFTGLAENVTLPVRVRTLASIIDEYVEESWMMKMDIEGMEFPVLASFFEESDPAHWPDYVIVEAFGHVIPHVGGSPLELMINRGFTLEDHDSSNFCLVGPRHNRRGADRGSLP